MAGLAYLMLAWRASGLTIESETPDAHCPPLTDVQEAVYARVGDVQGGGYVVRYGLVRDAATATTAVRLVLRDEEEEEVLSREIPVTDDACGDVALAIAVVLERYFAGVIRLHSTAPATPAVTESEPPDKELPSDKKTTSTTEPMGEPNTTATDPEDPGEETKRRPSTGDEDVDPQLFGSFVRVGAGVAEGPQPIFHGAWGLWDARRWGIVAQLFMRPLPVSQRYDDIEATSTLYGFRVGPTVSAPMTSKLRARLEPSFGWSFQRARASAAGLSGASAKWRAIPTPAAAVALESSVTEQSDVGIWVQGAVLLGGTRFIVGEGPSEFEILPLPTTSGDVSVYWAYRF